MNNEKAKYIVPTEDGLDNKQIFLETTASAVQEEKERSFLTKKQKDFLVASQDNILLKEDVVNNFTSEATDKPASADTVRRLKNQVNNIVFVASYEDPVKSDPGQIILWVDLASLGKPE